MSDLRAEGGLPATRPRPVDWLFRPFVWVAGGQALGLGLAVVALLGVASYAAWLEIGATWRPGVRPPAAVFVFEMVVDWVVLCGALLLAGRLAAGARFRALDLFGTQALARWPMVIAALAPLAPGFATAQRAFQTFQQLNPGWMSLPPLSALQWAVLWGVTIVLALCTVWTILLQVQSYRVCTNLSGWRLAWSFIVGLLLAQVVMRVALSPLAEMWLYA